MVTEAVQKLVARSQELFDAPPSLVEFTGEKAADRLLNDFENHAHAFVLACIMDQQIKAERAWLIPFRIAQRLGDFRFEHLKKLTLEEIKGVMSKPEPLHRFNDRMGSFFYAAIQRIAHEYSGDASSIWNDKPSSAELVHRFLEFNGVGPKIATMASNILARDFKIPLSDYYSIDVSVDVHLRRVFTRLNLIKEGEPIESVIYRARALSPEFPGLLDYPAWEIGRKWCRPTSPRCDECYMATCCPSALNG